ncbi:hypothetical protein [Agaribacter flavus]|uniref:Histidine phosphatase family protein n=1 Tax=Agaribacter flavus TaxID=1902781 RepID=A0ABV7FJJ5_9ALTE
MLIRHGKPSSADSPSLCASGYLKWLRRYNKSDVMIHSRPKNIEEEFKRYYSVSSDFTRAVHSAEIYTGTLPNEVDIVYREMDIPYYRLPFKLKPMTWVYLCRALWILGLKGNFESYDDAKQRALLVSNNLENLAQTKGAVVQFGHGYMNLHVRGILRKRGWTLMEKSNNFWGVSHLRKLA